ncbi:MAG: hypothetical protein LBS24_07560 [Clostridiales Family XIII bacterium]|jgi:hypothetical protein|nr:hypothetical protein [Clostridiales Family XIII bacterium]
MTKKHEGQNEIKAHENTFTVQRYTHTTANGFKIQFECVRYDASDDDNHCWARCNAETRKSWAVYRNGKVAVMLDPMKTHREVADWMREFDRISPEKTPQEAVDWMREFDRNAAADTETRS